MAHCETSLGRLYRRTAHPKEAQEDLTTAKAMHGERGAAYWLEKLAKD